MEKGKQNCKISDGADATHLQQRVGCGWSVVDGAGLSAVQLVQATVALHKADKVQQHDLIGVRRLVMWGKGAGGHDAHKRPRALTRSFPPAPLSLFSTPL